MQLTTQIDRNTHYLGLSWIKYALHQKLLLQLLGFINPYVQDNVTITRENLGQEVGDVNMPLWENWAVGWVDMNLLL